MKEHLVHYISYINNILINIKLIELIESKLYRCGSWEWGREHGYEVPR